MRRDQQAVCRTEIRYQDITDVLKHTSLLSFGVTFHLLEALTSIFSITQAVILSSQKIF